MRTGQLGVDVRGFDHGEDVALFHVRAEIEVPVFQVSRDAGVYRSLKPGLDGAGEHEALRRGARSRRNHHDGRYRLLLRPLRNLGLVTPALQYADNGNADRYRGGDNPHSPKISRWWRRRVAPRPVIVRGHQVLRSGGGCGLKGFGRFWHYGVAPGMQQAEDGGNKKQRRNGRYQ